MTAETADAMKAMIDRAERGLKALPKYDHNNRGPRDRALGALSRELRSHGALIDGSATADARMEFRKVRSTCTAGTAGVIRNWCVSARKRLGIYHE